MSYAAFRPSEADEAGRPYDLEAFLDRILPKQGLRCVAEISPDPRKPGDKIVRHHFGRTNAEAAQIIAKLGSKEDVEVYHACASFADDSSRKATNVEAVKAYWLDIDVGNGKPYPDAKSAWAAVVGFVRKAGLPVPWGVHSGGGLHVYWPLDEAIDAAAWGDDAKLLKAACVTYGLQADPSRTADAASILRPPGTINRKPERKGAVVRVRHEGKAVGRAGFRAALAKVVNTAPVAGEFALPGPAPEHIAALGMLPSNDDLKLTSAQLAAIRPPLDMRRVESAARALPARLLIGRDYWLQKLLWPLTATALDHPEHARALKALFVEVSRQEGAFKGEKEHANGFNERASEVQWEEALRATGQRRATGGETANLGSLFHAAEEAGWVDSALLHVPAPAHTPRPTLDELEAHRFTSWTKPAHKRRPILGGMAYRGEVTVFVGQGGLAKSTVATGGSASTASGRPLLGINPGPRVPVLMINAEDCRAEVALKFIAVRQHHRLSPGELADVFIYGAEDCGSILLTESNERGRERVNDLGLSALRQLIERTGAKLIILDPLAALVPYGLNDNGLMAAVMKRLKQIAQDCDCGIMLVAHTRKGADADLAGAEITAGAAAITNLARGVFTIRRPSERVCQEIGVPIGCDHHIRELVDLKANLKPLGERSFFRLVGVNMQNGTAEYPEPDWVAVAEPFTPQLGGRTVPPPVLRATAECLAKGHNGMPFSPDPQGRKRYYLGTLPAAIAPHLSGISGSELQAMAKAAVDQAQRDGWLEIREVTIKPRNKRKGVFVIWGATPWANDPVPGQFVA